MEFEIIKTNEEKKTVRDNSIFDNNNIMPVTETSDTAETIKELNDDSIKDKFSNIDMKTRLAQIEISSIIALDTLISFDFLPQEVGNLTRSKKRLAVSLNGLGRSEIVSIAQGMQEKAQGTSMFEKIGGFFGSGKK